MLSGRTVIRVRCCRMWIRNHIVARWLATIIVGLVVLSAQSWASHVHWSADDQQSVAGQMAEQVADDASNAGAAGQSDVGQNDHCGHAGTHLVGLHQEPVGHLVGCSAVADATTRAGYQSVDHEPPVEPPIA